MILELTYQTTIFFNTPRLLLFPFRPICLHLVTTSSKTTPLPLFRQETSSLSLGPLLEYLRFLRPPLGYLFFKRADFPRPPCAQLSFSASGLSIVLTLINLFAGLPNIFSPTLGLLHKNRAVDRATCVTLSRPFCFFPSPLFRYDTVYFAAAFIINPLPPFFRLAVFVPPRKASTSVLARLRFDSSATVSKSFFYPLCRLSGSPSFFLCTISSVARGPTPIVRSPPPERLCSAP